MITQLLFYCFARKKDLDMQGEVEISLHAAYPSEKMQPELYAETKKFFNATPSGQLVFKVKNDEIANYYKSGKYYRITMEEVANPNAQ
jgi:hypothetical protein